jgi:hypothetical protein
VAFGRGVVVRHWIGEYQLASGKDAIDSRSNWAWLAVADGWKPALQFEHAEWRRSAESSRLRDREQAVGLTPTPREQPTLNGTWND